MAAAGSGSQQQQAWDFAALEEATGLRFSWNEWPSSKQEVAQHVVPLGCVFTPLRPLEKETMPAALKYEPIRCQNANCKGILNPLVTIDFRSKMWACPFCMTRNQFPANYAQAITPQNLPLELFPRHTTVEYELPAPPAGTPVFLFVVDMCLDDEEMGRMKKALIDAMEHVPDNCYLGLVSFGTMVHVHELGFRGCPKSFVFKGTKDYESQTVATMLGLGRQQSVAPQAAGGAGGQAAQPGAAKGWERFFVPAGDAKANFVAAVQMLDKDPWPVKDEDRPQRCAGAALSVASSLLEKAIGWRGARMMLLTGGPPTCGPGQVIDVPLRTSMRSHTDITKGKEAAKYVKDATEFFDELGRRCVQHAHVLDVFACSLDQVGFLELSNACAMTGGRCVLADDFAQSIFSHSFERMWFMYDEESHECDRGHLEMGFGATLEVQTSGDFKVCGAIGHCTSLKKEAPCVSDSQVGEGGTYVWALGGLDANSSVALYFDVAADAPRRIEPTKRRYLQLVTRYQHSSGKRRMRVTTVAGAWRSDPDNQQSMIAGFDQEAAAVLLTRIAVHRTRTELSDDIMHWIDRSLIRLCSKFASYQPDNAQSFRLPQTMGIFPQFMFNLRRSPILQVGGASPDETAYRRTVLLREDVTNSLTMIQPSLLSYSFTGPPQPVTLDAESAREDVILLLDTFFNIIIWHGRTIAQWRNQGYQDQPQHSAFRQLLQAPQNDAQEIMADRFPVPRYVMCDQGLSQARFLMARLNPSITHQSGAAGGGGQTVLTDDVSFKVFMDHLISFAVAS